MKTVHNIQLTSPIEHPEFLLQLRARRDRRKSKHEYFCPRCGEHPFMGMNLLIEHMRDAHDESLECLNSGPSHEYHINNFKAHFAIQQNTEGDDKADTK